MSIKLEVWGDYALFTRPEMKVERVSYDVMTPSAARGLIEAIYWHPGLTWVIDRVHVCAPIHFTNLRRNEVKSTISGPQCTHCDGTGIRRFVSQYLQGYPAASCSAFAGCTLCHRSSF